MATGLFVAGEWTSGAEPMEVRDKFSGAVIGSVTLAGSNDIERGLESAKRGAMAMAKLPAYRRLMFCKRPQERSDRIAKPLQS